MQSGSENLPRASFILPTLNVEALSQVFEEI